MTRSIKALLALAMGAGLVAGIGGCAQRGKSAEVSPKESGIPVAVAIVQTGEMTQTIAVTGSIKAFSEVT